MSQRGMVPEFEFSREGLRKMLKSLVSPLTLSNEALAYIEKQLPFSLIKKSVKKGIITESQVFEIVEKFANTLTTLPVNRNQLEIPTKFKLKRVNQSKTYPTTLEDFAKKITTKDVQIAYDNLRGSCPFCLK